MKIMFVSEKTLDECNPELVQKLLYSNSFSDVSDAYDEFGCDYEELVDTMFAITREKRIKNRFLNDKAVTDWLEECFIDDILDYLEQEFGEGINKKRFQKKQKKQNA